MTMVALREVIPGWPGEDVPANDRLDRDLLARAYQFSAAAHQGQMRNSGDPYVTHCVEVAKILADLQLDSITVATGLIHDVVEDTKMSVVDVEREFGAEIASIVDGLTKISKLPAGASSQDRQVENYRKLLLLSIAKDARVIIIKLADRLHNMRTLDWLPPEKRRRIAQETRDLYAPLAHRFGMAKMRWELEDLAFKHLESEAYKSLAKLVAQKRGEREQLIAQFREPLERALARAGIAEAEVTGRPKHLWSIYKKMTQRQKPYEEIYDLLAVRVLVGSVPECYHALGIIHDGWTPVQERIKDYIAQPKPNGYQSLHTTVFGPGRQLYELQIRTHEMHRTADYGIAAHWLYKEDAKSADELDRHLTWFRQVLELQLDAKTPDEFLEFLKLDLYQDEIFVFTPTGHVIQLPKGATPIDFAFAVHTEIGLHCSGARVNGKIAPPLARPPQLGNGGDHRLAHGPTNARLAGPCAYGARATQDPAGPQARSAAVGGKARAGYSRPRGPPPSPRNPTPPSLSGRPRYSGSPMPSTFWHRWDRGTYRSPTPSSTSTRNSKVRRRRSPARSSVWSIECAAPRGCAFKGWTASWCATHSAVSQFPVIRWSGT